MSHPLCLKAVNRRGTTARESETGWIGALFSSVIQRAGGATSCRTPSALKQSTGGELLRENPRRAGSARFSLLLSNKQGVRHHVAPPLGQLVMARSEDFVQGPLPSARSAFADSR